MSNIVCFKPITDESQRELSLRIGCIGRGNLHAKKGKNKCLNSPQARVTHTALPKRHGAALRSVKKAGPWSYRMG